MPCAATGAVFSRAWAASPRRPGTISSRGTATSSITRLISAMVSRTFLAPGPRIPAKFGMGTFRNMESNIFGVMDAPLKTTSTITATSTTTWVRSTPEKLPAIDRGPGLP